MIPSVSFKPIQFGRLPLLKGGDHPQQPPDGMPGADPNTEEEELRFAARAYAAPQLGAGVATANARFGVTPPVATAAPEPGDEGGGDKYLQPDSDKRPLAPEGTNPVFLWVSPPPESTEAPQAGSTEDE